MAQTKAQDKFKFWVQASFAMRDRSSEGTGRGPYCLLTLTHHSTTTSQRKRHDLLPIQMFQTNCGWCRTWNVSVLSVQRSSDIQGPCGSRPQHGGKAPLGDSDVRNLRVQRETFILGRRSCRLPVPLPRRRASIGTLGECGQPHGPYRQTFFKKQRSPLNRRPNTVPSHGNFIPTGHEQTRP